MPSKAIHQQYYLIPFPLHDDEAIKVSSKKYAAKQNCVVIPMPMRDGCLARVEPNATLIVDGHGTRDSASVTADWKKISLGVSPDKLAQLLSEVGKLPATHVKIRLLACWGAYKAAPALAVALGKQGYKSIRVAGYKGPVMTIANANGRGSNPVKSDDEELSYDKSRVAWFDCTGKEVQKPAVAKYKDIEVDDWG